MCHLGLSIVYSLGRVCGNCSSNIFNTVSGVIPVIEKHGRPTTLRQIAPTLFYLACVLLVAIGLWSRELSVAVMLPAIYTVALVLAGIEWSVQKADAWLRFCPSRSQRCMRATHGDWPTDCGRGCFMPAPGILRKNGRDQSLTRRRRRAQQGGVGVVEIENHCVGNQFVAIDFRDNRELRRRSVGRHRRFLQY